MPTVNPSIPDESMVSVATRSLTVGTRITKPQLLVLSFIALAPRVIGALWLPNAFGDAYAYSEQIYYMRRALVAGSFSWSNLFGFWLPLYQLLCAILSALVGNPFYVPKLVSAVSGAGVCIIVFLLTWELTQNNFVSIASFALVAVNPYHVLYSSSAMTDVPHAFFILVCAFCCMKERWLLASLCGLSAGLMRIESWVLVPLIPLMQLLKQGRSSLFPGRESRALLARVLTASLFNLRCLILILGPALWLFVSWRASGSPWKYFEIRNQYIVETLSASPWLATFAPWRVGFDFVRLIYTANPVVLLVCCTTALLMLIKTCKSHISFRGCSPVGRGNTSLWSTLPTMHISGAGRIGELRNSQNERTNSAAIMLLFFFSHLTFLLLAYFTRNQPEIWPRYGLLFFTLGVPIFARHVAAIPVTSLFPNAAVPGRQRLLLYVTATVFTLQFCVQLVDVTRFTVQSDPNKIAAEFLEDQHLADRSLKVYCEDGAIRVLSRIPLEEFKDQYNFPADSAGFLRSLRQNQIRLLVHKDVPGSRVGEVIRQMKSGRLDARRDGVYLEEIAVKPRKTRRETIRLYRVHMDEVAERRRR
jgi:hypothetical protein